MITNKSPELKVTNQKLHLLIQFLWLLRFKIEFKCQIVSKFDLGPLNAYKQMYFHRNINRNKDHRILEGNK